METIGEKIYNLRKKKFFSQEELAYRVGVSRQTISKWESDAMNPSVENIKTLCNVFAISVNYFLSNEEEIIKEIAETEVDVQVIPKTKSKRNTMLLISVIVISFLLMISLCLTVAIGFLSLTTNKGDVVVTTSKIDGWFFGICLLITIILVLLDIYISILLCKNRKKRSFSDKM